MREMLQQKMWGRGMQSTGSGEQAPLNRTIENRGLVWAHAANVRPQLGWTAAAGMLWEPTRESHQQFPPVFRSSVQLIMLARQRLRGNGEGANMAAPLAGINLPVLEMVFCHLAAAESRQLLWG
jgi:hypothetical protein